MENCGDFFLCCIVILYCRKMRLNIENNLLINLIFIKIVLLRKWYGRVIVIIVL